MRIEQKRILFQFCGFLLSAVPVCVVPLVAQATVHPKPVKAGGQVEVSHQDCPQIVSQTQQPSAAQFDELAHRLRMVEEKASQQENKWYKDILTPLATAIIGFFAVFWSARLGLAGQARAATAASNAAELTAKTNAEIATNAATQATQLAKDAALFKHAEQIMEFKLKQIQEFYGPLYAALQQSRALYDKLMDQLLWDDPERYRKTPEGSETNFRLLVIDKDGQWKDFRLVDQLPGIKSNERAMAFVDAILDIGKIMCQIISTKAGYAAEDAVEMLGKYMAHHAILTTIRNGPEKDAFDPGRHKVGAFPYGLDKVIGDKYNELSNAIEKYGEAYDRTLQLLREKAS